MRVEGFRLPVPVVARQDQLRPFLKEGEVRALSETAQHPPAALDDIFQGILLIRDKTRHTTPRQPERLFFKSLLARLRHFVIDRGLSALLTKPFAHDHQRPTIHHWHPSRPSRHPSAAQTLDEKSSSLLFALLLSFRRSALTVVDDGRVRVHQIRFTEGKRRNRIHDGQLPLNRAIAPPIPVRRLK